MASLWFRTALALTLALALFVVFPLDGLARGGGHSGRYSPQSSSSLSSHRSALRRRRHSIECERAPATSRARSSGPPTRCQN